MLANVIYYLAQNYRLGGGVDGLPSAKGAVGGGGGADKDKKDGGGGGGGAAGGGGSFYCRLRLYNGLKQGRFSVKERRTTYNPFKLAVCFKVSQGDGRNRRHAGYY